jgi:aryl-alcohol dehydrogenase-like predicted oxidoreductase
MMRYRKFGSSQLMVSEIGVGGGGLGHVWGPTSDEAVHAAIRFALDEGINFFDVAPGYGAGLAETNLGIALGPNRPQAVIATKVRLAEDEFDDIPGAIERSLAASLERLQTEHVDLYQLHNRITAERSDARGSVSLHDVLGSGGVVETLHRLKSSEQTRLIGFTGVGDAAAVREVMQNAELDSVQVYYNLLNPSAASPLADGSTLWDHGQILPLAEELGMAAIGIRNLAAGVLSAGVDRPIDDDSLFGRDRQRAKALDFLSADGTPLSQAATRFVLDHSAIASVIPGVKDQSEVVDAIASIELPPLDDTQRHQLAELAATDFGVAEPPGSMM